MRIQAVLVSVVVGLAPQVASAQAILEVRTGSGEDPGEAFALRGERVRVAIDDQYARTTLQQTWDNRSEEQLEGRYLLQLGEGALVTGFAYWNGEQKIRGEVFEKEVAQQVYGEITGLGRDPGLFEQVGEGAFTFRVFPITAGEAKRVEVGFGKYLTRVGDRVEYRLALAGGEADIEVEIADGRTINDVASSTHKIKVERDGDRVRVRASGHGETELVVSYRVEAEPWSLRATVHRDAGEDAYVVLSLGAPADAAAAQVAKKDVTIVIDRSGSMSGEPMANALLAGAAVVGRLKAGDRVNIIVFDDDVDALYDQPREVTDATRKEALDYLARVQSGGGTDIARALDKALASQIADGQPDVILFMTDGQSDTQAALKVARGDKGDARVYTVGLGDGVEKPLLSRLAAEKRGRFTFIESAAAIEPRVTRLFEQIEQPVLLDVSVSAEGASLARVYPRTLPDLSRGDELVVAGRVHGNGTVTFKISGTVDGKRVTRELKLALPEETRRPWVGRMWAKSRVDDLLEQIALEGETDELKNEVIDLALAYELVTPYSSFLALPEEELTDEAAATVADARERKAKIRQAHKDAAALSRDDMPPGDPVLSVRAPRDAQQVTAYFPFGLVQDLKWDGSDEAWKVRFLVPVDVPDGVYQAKVVIVHADGSVEIAAASYTIDSSEPDFMVETIDAPGGVMVRVTVRGGAAGLVTVALASDPRVRLQLVATADGKLVWEGFLALPEGAHELRVVVADTARNESDQLVQVEVR